MQWGVLTMCRKITNFRWKCAIFILPSTAFNTFHSEKFIVFLIKSLPHSLIAFQAYLSFPSICLFIYQFMILQLCKEKNSLLLHKKKRKTPLSLLKEKCHDCIWQQTTTTPTMTQNNWEVKTDRKQQKKKGKFFRVQIAAR